MNKIKKILILMSLFGTVGVAYAIFVLKSIPETFDFNLKEEEEDEVETSI